MYGVWDRLMLNSPAEEGRWGGSGGLRCGSHGGRLEKEEDSGFDGGGACAVVSGTMVLILKQIWSWALNNRIHRIETAEPRLFFGEDS